MPSHDAVLDLLCLADRLGGALFGDNIGDTTAITEGKIKAIEADATSLGVDYVQVFYGHVHTTKLHEALTTSPAPPRRTEPTRRPSLPHRAFCCPAPPPKTLCLLPAHSRAAVDNALGVAIGCGGGAIAASAAARTLHSASARVARWRKPGLLLTRGVVTPPRPAWPPKRTLQRWWWGLRRGGDSPKTEATRGATCHAAVPLSTPPPSPEPPARPKRRVALVDALRLRQRCFRCGRREVAQPPKTPFVSDPEA